MPKLYAKLGWLALLINSLSPPCWCDVLVTEVRQPKGSDFRTSVDVLSELKTGISFELPAQTVVVAVDLESGNEFQANGPGIFQVTASGVQSTTGVIKVRTLSTQRLPPIHVATATVARAAMQMRSWRHTANLAPYNSGVLLTTPRLFWKPVSNAIRYRIVLYAANSVIGQAEVNATELTVPKEWALIHGNWYRWTLEPVGSETSRAFQTMEAFFWVVPADSVAILSSIHPGKDNSLSAWVLYAAQLQEAGATEDAQRVWRDLSEKHPDTPRFKLLAQ